jgi:hypothetical protein
MQMIAQTGRDTLNFLPPAIPPSVFAVETTEDMAIDGKLTETVWQRAPVVSDFFPNSRLAANPRMQLSAFYQYNTFDERGRWNVRGSWEFAPLSFVYLVLNENDIRQTNSRNRSEINKISYLRQF